MAFVYLVANFFLAFACLPSEGARTVIRSQHHSVTDGPVVVNANENLWGEMMYSFKLSATALNFVEPERILFDTSGSDYHVLSRPQVVAISWSSQGAEETSQYLSASISLEGEYSMFAAVAEANLDRYNSNRVQTVRVSKSITAVKYRVTPYFADPWNKLRPDVLQFMRTATVESIVATYGEFYARSMVMGGQFETVHVMEKTDSDTKTSLSLQLEGNYSSILVSAVANFQGNLTEHSLVSKNSMRTSWRVSGGDSQLWLGLTESNLGSIKEQWANTVDDDNLFPIEVDYAPIWQLLEPHDAEKAQQLEAYLLNKWSDDLNGLPEYPSAPAAPVHIYRYYSSAAHDHEYTTRSTPFSDRYVAEGIAFNAFAVPGPGTVPVYSHYRRTRYWAGGLLYGGRSHIYTTNGTAAYNPHRPWIVEGVAFYAFGVWNPDTGTVPINRYDNAVLSDHEFTTRNTPFSSNWVFSGVAFYAFP